MKPHSPIIIVTIGLIIVLLATIFPPKEPRLVRNETLMKIYYKGYIDGIRATQKEMMNNVPWRQSYAYDSAQLAKIIF